MRHHLARMDEFNAKPGPWTATGSERPVFFDERCARRRWVLFAGLLAGGGAACWLGALVAGAIGFSTLPSLARHQASLFAKTSRAPHRQLLAERSPDRGLDKVR